MQSSNTSQRNAPCTPTAQKHAHARIPKRGQQCSIPRRVCQRHAPNTRPCTPLSATSAPNENLSAEFAEYVYCRCPTFPAHLPAHPPPPSPGCSATVALGDPWHSGQISSRPSWKCQAPRAWVILWSAPTHCINGSSACERASSLDLIALHGPRSPSSPTFYKH